VFHDSGCTDDDTAANAHWNGPHAYDDEFGIHGARADGCVRGEAS
jgi:hypothetical protein